MNRSVVNKVIVLLVVLFISALFLTMIRQFLMAILLAGIFSGMAQPIFRRVERWTGGRKSVASAVTLAVVFFLIFIPLAVVLGMVARQAIEISNSVAPWIEQWIAEPTAFREYFQAVPFYDTFLAYEDVILEKAGELVGSVSGFLFENLSDVTRSTITFLFLFFVFLYTMFFLLKDGHLLLAKILYYLPLESDVEARILDRFTSVTRATLKGTLMIGIIQGGLAGLAFWAVGISGFLFWGTVMTVLSIIPAVGSALVWVPAAVILAATGEFLKAAGLFLFCGIMVGSIDNILRPRFVGRDTKLHELLIFFGTLGGISLFGIIGFIIGPIVTALFVTVWDIYGATFSDYLPEVKKKPLDPGPGK